MRRDLAGIALVVGVALSFICASSASAAREAGDDCVANTVEANRTMIPWNSGSFEMNRAVNEQDVGEEEGALGVVTGWKVRVGPGQTPLPQRLEIYRVVNEKEEYRQEFQTPLETIHPGDNFFPARIPVWAGANLGLYGPNGTFACNTGELLATGTFEGSASLGEVRTVTGLIGFRAPLTVVVERDQDRDGYGDETQDGCPVYALSHTACPVLTLISSVTATTKRAILLDVGTGDPAQVQVSGQIGWGIRRRAHGRPAKRKARVVFGLSGGTQDIPAAATVTFTIPLPKAVERRLAKLSPKENLKAHLFVTATNPIGHQVTRYLIVRLPGRQMVASKR
jgi:hypothetical protein